MPLVQVGWVAAGEPEPEEYLVNMTEAQFREVEDTLKRQYQKGDLSEYWIADAVVLPFSKFSRLL